ncbi:protein FAM161A isoform X2 [Pleurodeles waltl]|uniref:protein FAM161A isoform X2 n=1 Tax=Pleurodeles waltl TaxID=8319 RepID=UPI00370939C5
MEQSHRASVLAASCLSTPVNPHTRAPVTLYERQQEEERWRRGGGAALDGKEGGSSRGAREAKDDFDSGSESESGQPFNQSVNRDFLVQTHLAEMNQSNKEYYTQLEQLKKAHIETMAQLESMYQRKLHLEGVVPHCKQDTSDVRSAWKSDSFNKHHLQKSFSELDLNSINSSTSEDSEDDLNEECSISELRVLSPAEKRILKMWNGFFVEDYVESKQRSPRPAKEKKAKEWSPKITVPEPFQMTLREAKKKQHCVKTKSEIEMENNLLKKYLEEEAECQKKFKANPVPASVFLPLYREIMERKDERRKFVKDRRRELLLASQQPFQFIEREERKKEMLKEQLEALPAPRKKARPFKAKPVPKSIYSSNNSDRLQEEELYRGIKMQMRAQELLQSSVEPRSFLASRSKLATHKHKCLQSEEPQHKPKINSQVPDFEELHRKFQKQLLKKKDSKPVTICEPFCLRTLQIASNKAKILEDIQADEEVLYETRWPYQTPRRKPRSGCYSASSSLCRALEYEPPRTTESTKRRQQAIRQSIMEKAKLEEDQKKRRAQQKQRMEKLQKLITTRARASDSHKSIAQMSKTKIKQLRDHERQRMREYFQELGQMEARIDKRPLLLERATQINARLSAEKHFSDVLKEAGLKEDLFLKKGQALPSHQHFSDEEPENTTRDLSNLQAEGEHVKESFDEEIIQDHLERTDPEYEDNEYTSDDTYSEDEAE